MEKSQALELFDGDSVPFESIKGNLEACLVKAKREPKKVISYQTIFFIAIFGIIIGFYVFFHIRNNYRFQNYIEKLSSEPGIILTSTKNIKENM